MKRLFLIVCVLMLVTSSASTAITITHFAYDGHGTSWREYLQHGPTVSKPLKAYRSNS